MLQCPALATLAPFPAEYPQASVAVTVNEPQALALTVTTPVLASMLTSVPVIVQVKPWPQQGLEAWKFAY